MRTKTWYKLFCKSSEIQLKGTLNGGQSFRWKRNVNSEGQEEWLGVFSNLVWILRQTEDHILYQVYENSSLQKYNGKIENGYENIENLNGEVKNQTKKATNRKKNVNQHKKLEIENWNENIKNQDIPENSQFQSAKLEMYETMLKNYFRLDIDLQKLYSQWSESDPNFTLAAKEFYGIRMLNQEPVENLFSFICSSNNNITRISSMVEKLARFYGEKICEIDGIEYFAFPNIVKLAADDVENKLRQEGFGYRASYIAKSAKMIVEMGGEKWFEKLKSLEYKDAKTELIKLTGIGAKVADCICLMSLNHLEAIPVDTHVYQITARNYMKQLTKQKTVTEKIYNEIGEFFRNLYGPYAGWAQTVLFCADLKIFNQEETIPPKKRKK